MTEGCCGSIARGGAEAPAVADVPEGGASGDLRAAVRDTLVEVSAGFFEMGTRKPRYPDDHEGPQRRVWLDGYRIGRFSVTNALFARFVAESGYVTVAEREGWSYVFHLFLSDLARYPNSPQGTPWWRQVHGATWAAPEGPGSDVATRADHPVVHVAWDDAVAFARFCGLRLPTEAEWEKAARGGLRGKKFPWGNTLEPADGHRHNVWQGDFPRVNTADDGHVGTAPVAAYQPNGYGIWNMTGNVWEWCTDWFGPPEPTRPGNPLRNPQGPATGEGRVVRGGSYLCHASYCERYHVHSRTRNTPDSSTGHMGFRVAAAL